MGDRVFIAGLIGSLGLLAATAAPAQDRGQDQGVVKLNTITVDAGKSKASGDKGPVAKQARAGSKTDTPIIETPQSVSVVTSGQAEKQGATTVANALLYEPGVTVGSRPGDRFDSLYIRGFGGFGGNANYVHYWDGLRLPAGLNYNIPSIDPYFLDRIEIIRGPSSVLYGSGNPGGLVSLVSKEPEAEASHEIFTRFGNHSRAETGFDFTGPLNQDGTLLYRVTGVGRLYDTDVDYSRSERLAIAPTLTWKPDTDTTLTIRGSYTYDPKSVQTNWMPALGTLQANPNGRIPYDFFSGNPNYDTFNRKQASIGYNVEHRLDDVWTLRQNLRFMHDESEFKAYSVVPNAKAWAAAARCGGIAYLCLGRQSTHYIERFDALAVDNQAEADFDTGRLQHKVLLGLDYQWVNAHSTYGNGPVTYIDYLDPVYERAPNVALTSRQDQTRRQLGIYAQDQMTVDNWHFVLAGRNDWSSIDSSTTTLATGASRDVETRDHAFTWKAGVLYEFDNGIAPYASYSTSFDPTMGTGYGGVPFEPTTSQQYEVGVKYKPDGFDGLFTVALYNLTQQNVLTTDLDHTGSNTGCSSSICQTQTGEIRSRGVELGAKVALLDGLNLSASYTYADMEVKKSNVASTLGKTPVGVPDNMASLWADYTIPHGALQGLNIGAGVRYMGSSHGDAANTKAMKVPAFTLVDASISYDFGNYDPKLKGLKLAVSATNLFDKHYVSACASAYQCFYGTGRTVMATTSYKW
ncbi:MAG: TonB-dependent siderophore receptor [Rhizobiales bacterium]|nr:TonB-dependent siderophore receptor [Hyphomicrobiales bacterium]OJY07412.1 MAG: ferrichrome-iron receptor [Rhizobiales bacterium 63-22]